MIILYDMIDKYIPASHTIAIWSFYVIRFSFSTLKTDIEWRRSVTMPVLHREVYVEGDALFRNATKLVAYQKDNTTFVQEL